MAKYKVLAYQLIKTEISFDAKDLESAKELLNGKSIQQLKGDDFYWEVIMFTEDYDALSIEQVKENENA